MIAAHLHFLAQLPEGPPAQRRAGARGVVPEGILEHVSGFKSFTTTQVASAQRQLGNEHFLGKAPSQVVEGLRKQAADNELLLQKTRAALEKLG